MCSEQHHRVSQDLHPKASCGQKPSAVGDGSPCGYSIGRRVLRVQNTISGMKYPVCYLLSDMFINENILSS